MVFPGYIVHLPYGVCTISPGVTFCVSYLCYSYFYWCYCSKSRRVMLNITGALVFVLNLQACVVFSVCSTWQYSRHIQRSFFHVVHRAVLPQTRLCLCKYVVINVLSCNSCLVFSHIVIYMVLDVFPI